MYFDHFGALCGHIPNAVRSGVFSLFILYCSMEPVLLHGAADLLHGAGSVEPYDFAQWSCFFNFLWFLSLVLLFQGTFAGFN